MTSSSLPSVTSSSVGRRSRRSVSGGNCAVAPCRRVALVKPSWNTMIQTQSFDETLSRTSTRCQSPTVTTISSSSTSRSRRLRINVCGLYFETFISQLDRHPSTLLGDHQQRMRFYDAARDEVFLDRHRPTFEAVSVYHLKSLPLAPYFSPVCQLRGRLHLLPDWWKTVPTYQCSIRCLLSRAGIL